MNGRTARRLRKEAKGIAAAMSAARGVMPQELHHAPPGIAVWTGRRRIYQVLKRRTQPGRPMPAPSSWFLDALKSGQIKPTRLNSPRMP